MQIRCHIADTIAAGGALCDERVVEMVVREAPERIRELIEWGTRFDRRAGALLLGREGGHGRRRVAHALADATAEIPTGSIHICYPDAVPPLQFGTVSAVALLQNARQRRNPCEAVAGPTCFG